MKKILLSAVLTFGMATAAIAEVGETHIEDFDFSFEGPFGKFDQYQLQQNLHKLKVKTLNLCINRQHFYSN